MYYKLWCFSWQVTSCVFKIVVQLTVNVTGNWGTTFITASNVCICRALLSSSVAAVGLGSAPGFVLSLLGSCANYTSSNSTCQNVYYSGTGCIGIDGTKCLVNPTSLIVVPSNSSYSGLVFSRIMAVSINGHDVSYILLTDLPSVYRILNLYSFRSLGSLPAVKALVTRVALVAKALIFKASLTLPLVIMVINASVNLQY